MAENTVPGAKPAETTTPAPAAAPAAAPADDIDALFKEFEDGTQAPVVPAPAAAPARPAAPTVEALSRQVNELQSRLVGEDFEKAVKSTIDTIKDRDDRLKPVSEKVVRALLDVQAREDPRIRSAFDNRQQNPQAWGKILSSIAKKLGDEFAASMPNENLTNARDAARHLAVGSHSSAPPGGLKSVAEMKRMSDSELAEYAKSIDRDRARA